MFRERGMMDGWHGDEPEIEALQILHNDRENYPEDDDRRQRECLSDYKWIEGEIKKDNMELLHMQLENLKKLYGGK
jgi:hypothetical protein